VGKNCNDRVKNITARLTELFSGIVKHTDTYNDKERAGARAWEVLRRLLRSEPPPDNDPDAGTFKMYFDDNVLRPFIMDGATLAEIKDAAREVPGFPFKRGTSPKPTPPAPNPKPEVKTLPDDDKFPRPFSVSVAYGKHQALHNTVYPDYVFIDSMKRLLEVAKHDHCAAFMKDNKRGNGSFLYADVLIFDVDNTHTDAPAQWIKHDDIRRALPDFELYFVASRNNMKPKDGKAPRPKFHVYIPLTKTESESKYTAIIKNIIDDVNTKFGREVFDVACKDSTRPWFGNGGE